MLTIFLAKNAEWHNYHVRCWAHGIMLTIFLAKNAEWHNYHVESREEPWQTSEAT